jgi:hypothetical protein
MGEDVDVREFDSQLDVGSHHLVVFGWQGATNDPIEDCDSTLYDPILFVSQEKKTTVTYPPGIAVGLPATTGLRFSAHYLNATSAPISATVSVTVRLAAAGSVNVRAGSIWFNNSNINIPSDGAPHTVTRTCILPSAITFLSSAGHMHRRGVNFVVEAQGQQIYSSQSWDAPPFVPFDPPLAFDQGTPIKFSCTYVNNSGQPVQWGVSAATSEMCTYLTWGYPVPSGLQYDHICL